MKLTIEIEGEENEDLDLALDAVVCQLKGGYTSGFNSNESGKYWFDIKDSNETAAEKP